MVATKFHTFSLVLVLLTVEISHVSAAATCKDKKSDCREYTADACKGKYKTWAIQNCAATCNLCSEVTTPKPYEPPKCWQNYVGHLEGETWRNGCDTQCKCLDPSMNKIECSPICLNWASVLTDDCFMEPPAAGKCCSRPKCPPSKGLLFPNGYQFN